MTQKLAKYMVKLIMEASYASTDGSADKLISY